MWSNPITSANEASAMRLLAAAALHAGSKALEALARRIARIQQPAPRSDPVYEFYGEAGAPEGALYVDGELAGHLPGVSRL